MIVNIKDSSFNKIKSLDQKLNNKFGYQADVLIGFLNSLIDFNRVEVGWRECCGATHSTHKAYREWLKVISILRKEGLNIKEQRVKHSNNYATNNGGFWNSIIYETA